MATESTFLLSNGKLHNLHCHQPRHSQERCVCVCTPGGGEVAPVTEASQSWLISILISSWQNPAGKRTCWSKCLWSEQRDFTGNNIWLAAD